MVDVVEMECCAAKYDTLIAHAMLRAVAIWRTKHHPAA